MDNWHYGERRFVLGDLADADDNREAQRKLMQVHGS